VTRSEARALLALAVVLLVAGLVWLFGPYGLLGAGLLLAVLVLFVFNVEERTGAEAVAEPAGPGHRHPVLDRPVRH
jgi:predicted PurR-regulated permease PerM